MAPKKKIVAAAAAAAAASSSSSSLSSSSSSSTVKLIDRRSVDLVVRRLTKNQVQLVVETLCTQYDRTSWEITYFLKFANDNGIKNLYELYRLSSMLLRCESKKLETYVIQLGDEQLDQASTPEVLRIHSTHLPFITTDVDYWHVGSDEAVFVYASDPVVVEADKSDTQEDVHRDFLNIVSMRDEAYTKEEIASFKKSITKIKDLSASGASHIDLPGASLTTKRAIVAWCADQRQEDKSKGAVNPAIKFEKEDEHVEMTFANKKRPTVTVDTCQLESRTHIICDVHHENPISESSDEEGMQDDDEAESVRTKEANAVGDKFVVWYDAKGKKLYAIERVLASTGVAFESRVNELCKQAKPDLAHRWDIFSPRHAHSGFRMSVYTPVATQHAELLKLNPIPEDVKVAIGLDSLVSTLTDVFKMRATLLTDRKCELSKHGRWKTSATIVVGADLDEARKEFSNQQRCDMMKHPRAPESRMEMETLKIKKHGLLHYMLMTSWRAHGTDASDDEEDESTSRSLIKTKRGAAAAGVDEEEANKDTTKKEDEDANVVISSLTAGVHVTKKKRGNK